MTMYEIKKLCSSQGRKEWDNNPRDTGMVRETTYRLTLGQQGGLGFRTSKPPVPPPSGLNSRSWEDPKGGDSVRGRTLVYHHGLAFLILAPGGGSMNVGGGGGWGEHHLSFLKRKSKSFNSSPASTSSLQSSPTLKPTGSSGSMVLTMVVPCSPTFRSSPPPLPVLLT